MLYNIFLILHGNENIACFERFLEWRISRVNIFCITRRKDVVPEELKISVEAFKRLFPTGDYNKRTRLYLLLLYQQETK